MRVISSNRLEMLADRLADSLAKDPLDPMVNEIIVVQNAGMQRWLSLALAARNHVLAGCEFPFPVAFFDAVARQLLPDETEESILDDQDAIAFRIMGLLPALRDIPEAGDVHRYLGDTPDDLKLFQLSRRIARTFDQYAVYRPEMVQSWDKGGARHWQARLWRNVFPGGKHRADRLGRLLSRLHSGTMPADRLLCRVSVFGIANLPPVFVDVLDAISRHLPVTVYFLNPCREYWGDQLSDREQRRLGQWIGDAASTVDPNDLHLAPADRLLAAFGGTGRDFFDRLASGDADFEEAFESPGQGTLLAAVQEGMLDLSAGEEMDQRGSEFHSKPLAADGSIQIHACHTPLRSVEVLRDELLRLFDADATLAPQDILIMTPNIDTYAPLIKAVFESSGAPRLPVSIGDRTLLADSGPARALIRLLAAGQGRLAASEVMALLEEPDIRRRFAIGASDVTICQEWVRRSGIRWGVDGDWRESRGGDNITETTWRAGLDRLMAGFVMGDVDEPILNQIVPVPGIDDDQSDLLAAFFDFIEAVTALPDQLAIKRTPAEWAVILSGIVTRFIDPGPVPDSGFRRLRQIIESMHWDLSDASPMVGPEVIRDWLGRRCQSESMSGGFGTGGITCCAMVPMRAVPARVIAMVGLDTDAFPHQDRANGFDIMARYPRVGDRSQRRDDLYLILETLLSVRQVFYLSYVYRNIQDNTEKPPSVVVSQLMDALEFQYGVSGPSLVPRHFLHGTDPSYFIPGSPIQSYAQDRCVAIPSMMDRKPAGSVLAEPLDPPDAAWRQVDLDDLCEFFRNPSRYLITRRLGMVLTEPEDPVEDNMPVGLEGLERYRVGEDLLESGLIGGDSGLRGLIHRADGRLPPGAPGDLLFDQIRVEAARLISMVSSVRAEPPIQPLELALDCKDFRISGSMPGVTESGLVIYRFGPLRGKDWMDAWIRHLAVSMTAKGKAKPVTILVGFTKDGFNKRQIVSARLEPVSEADRHMDTLLAAYWQGLCEPLPFFPETSYSFIQKRETSGQLDKAWAEAERKWLGGKWSGAGESSDRYIRFCFRNRTLTEIPFEPLAESVVLPILAHCRK